MVRAMGAAGAFNIDTSRFYREALPPHVYLVSSYYKKWLLGLEDLLIDKGYIAADEVAGRPRAASRPSRSSAASSRSTMSSASWCAASSAAPAPAPAKFKPGDRVRAKNIHPATHTRLPRYVRGHVGVVERDHGCHVFPDSAAIEARREPAMALHGGVRRRRAVGRGRRPDGEDLDRRVRALSGAGVMEHCCGARDAAAVPSIPCDAEGPVFREPWEAQAFAMALALHERGLFTWPRMGRDAGRRDQARAGGRRSRHRRDLLPALARHAGTAGRREGRRRRRRRCALSRCLGPRRRPHAARQADRAAAGGFSVRLRLLRKRIQRSNPDVFRGETSGLLGRRAPRG